MQVSTKFTIAIHILVATEYFNNQKMKVTSDFLSMSIGSNPVIIRNLMLNLKEKHLIEIKRGPGGISLLKPLNEITYLDVYKAVETKSTDELFKFHEHPNIECPVGRNIHQALEDSLDEIQQAFEKELSLHKVEDVYDNVLKQLSLEKVSKQEEKAHAS